ncbi:response regulator [Emticicia sp. CRIBPO]|uniref:LytR/AlgR family response regulator transcription factor n=1 Tax=Emticicia sp. CRIBPO TaxID=2683258 RepID=UPI001412FEF5|nr:LytTR family DNA-binding domain-containing protein [Emticicia sp. CRIBPO]NBA85507.1 response regulator [Emticicia sp. CRIBPO]
MRIVIIEDEKLNASRLKKILLEIDPDTEVLEVLDTIHKSVEWLKENKHPDTILMDIRLADGLSFEIFAKVKVNCPVIFTTAYDEYAVRAFKVNGIDYLLKPVEKEELEAALQKVKTLISPDPAIEELMQFFRQKNLSYRTRFLIPFKDGYKTILVADVDFIYSEFKTTHLVLNDGGIETVAHTMEELEEQLDPDVFFRANRQHLVAVHSISSIHNFFNGKLKLQLKRYPEREVLISKEKATSFKQWLDR